MKPMAYLLLIPLLLLLFPGTSPATAKLTSLCEVHYPSDAGIEWSCRTLKGSDTPLGLFKERWQDVLRFNRMDRRHFTAGISIKVPRRLEEIRNFVPLPQRYPEAAGEPKLILVDQSEMFLGAYEYGKLVLSFPVAIGIEYHRVPNGSYRIDAADRNHESNLYTVEEIGRPYPMHYALRFFVDKSVETWPSYWIHGRDLPGYPASHGCIGLYDEEMQYEYYWEHDRKVMKRSYHELTPPFLEGAKTLYDWVVDPRSDPGSLHSLVNGPVVVVTGTPPL